MLMTAPIPPKPGRLAPLEAPRRHRSPALPVLAVADADATLNGLGDPR